jgi:lipopolysaccharide export system protein LptC
MGTAFPITAMAAEAERTGVPSARTYARHIAIVPPPDRGKAFARARPRSGRVRLLRKAILVSVSATVVAMVVIAIFDPFATKFGALSFLSLNWTKVTMASPKLTGFRGGGQPYSVTAEKALQDVKNPTTVELKKLAGDIGMAGGERMRISADSGIYDILAQRMRLSGNVRISSARFDVLLLTADIDFQTGSSQTDDPVEAHVGEQTIIFGDRAAARNSGQELTRA